MFFKTGVLRNFAKFTWNIFKNYESCLEATQLENKIEPLEKNEISVDSLKKDHKEFIKNKLILKHSNDLKVKGILSEIEN